MTPADDLETLTDDDLEEMLLDATSEGSPGRNAMARVTAIRTVLNRRSARRRAKGFDGDETLERLFADHRDLDERVRDGDWHPTPWLADLDATDTVRLRRGWYERLRREGMA